MAWAAAATEEPAAGKTFTHGLSGLPLRVPGPAKPKTPAAWWQALAEGADYGTSRQLAEPWDEPREEAYILIATLDPVPKSMALASLRLGEAPGDTRKGLLGSMGITSGFYRGPFPYRLERRGAQDRTKIGEMVQVHFPGAAGMSTVTLCVDVGRPTAPPAPAPVMPNPTDAFWDAVEAKQQRQFDSGAQNTDHRQPQVLEVEHGIDAVFWGHPWYDSELEQIRDHAIAGWGEAPSIKRNLRLDRDIAGNTRLAIFEVEWACIRPGSDRDRGLTEPQQLLATLALVETTRVGSKTPNGSRTSRSSSPASLLSSGPTYLLKLDDATLDIGACPGLEDISGKNREALYGLFAYYKKKATSRGGDSDETLRQKNNDKKNPPPARRRVRSRRHRALDGVRDQKLNFKPGKPKSGKRRRHTASSQKNKKQSR